MSKMLKTHTYHTLKDGPHLVIFGAVHGNETCGPKAINRLIDDIENDRISLQRGTLTLVPVCNPEAYTRNLRFYQRNLNRAMYVKESPQYYEDRIDPVLCHILDHADVLLDLHSYASEGTAFGFMGHSSQQEIDYCLALGIENFVYGWSEAFGKTDSDPKEAMGTVEYARSVGCIGTTIECGHHHNEDAADIGYATIYRALHHFNMIESSHRALATDHHFAKMQHVFFKEKAGETTKAWKHYDFVAQGEPLATYTDGTQITAPADGRIILPKLHAQIGGEWFYFGVQTNCPKPINLNSAVES